MNEELMKTFTRADFRYLCGIIKEKFGWDWINWVGINRDDFPYSQRGFISYTGEVGGTMMVVNYMKGIKQIELLCAEAKSKDNFELFIAALIVGLFHYETSSNKGGREPLKERVGSYILYHRAKSMFDISFPGIFTDGYPFHRIDYRHPKYDTDYAKTLDSSIEYLYDTIQHSKDNWDSRWKFIYRMEIK